MIRKSFGWIKKNIDYFVVSLLAMLWVLRSPLDFWDGGDCYTDSGVFMSIGQHMMKGFMPYRDIFDHKGPLIYVINWLGMSIKYYHGVWLMELITMVVTALLVYKLARLFCNRFFSILTFLISFWTIETQFNDGNFCEEYALPWLVMSLFFFTDYLLNKKINNTRLFLIGFGCAMVSMLRINMIALWVVFCVAILIKLIGGKNFPLLRKAILWFIVGFLSGVIPFFIWLMLTDSLQAFIEQYFLFNFRYSNSYFREKFGSFAYFGFTSLSLSTFCMLIYTFIKKKDKWLWGTFLVSFLLNLGTMAMSGRVFSHYGITLLPYYTLPIAYALSCIERLEKDSVKEICTIVLLTILSFSVLHFWVGLSETVLNTWINRNYDYTSTEVKEICETIDSMTSEDERISVYGNWNLIYLKSHRLSASKYAYQYPISEVEPSILDQYFEELSISLPKIVVVEWEWMDERISDFLTQNGYDEVYVSERGDYVFGK